MKVYLIQHAHAVPKQDDPARPLSEEGKNAIRKTAEVLKSLNLDISEIRHSSKLRARQTAQIVGEVLQKNGSVKESDGLAPTDPITPLVEELNKASQSIMLIGHMPHLGRLASRLLLGDEEHEPVAFHNAGVVCLGKNEEGWQIEWMLPPGLLPC